MWFIDSVARHVSLHRRLAHIQYLMEAIMTDLSKFQAEQARLVAAVTALRSVAAGVGAVVFAQVKQLHDLADQIAALQAGTVTQADIDAFADKTHDLADSVEAGTGEVTAAVTAGTVAAPPPVSVAPPVAAPVTPETPAPVAPSDPAPAV